MSLRNEVASGIVELRSERDKFPEDLTFDMNEHEEKRRSEQSEYVQETREFVLMERI